MAQLAQFAYAPWPDEDDPKFLDPATGRIDWMAHMNAEQEALDALLKASAALPDGKIVGAVLRWQRGDGFAFYVVTKERPLTLTWVPFCDKWSVEPALIRGLTKADILQMQGADRRIAAIFGRK